MIDIHALYLRLQVNPSRQKIIAQFLGVTIFLLLCCGRNAFSVTVLPGDFFIFPNIRVSNITGSGAPAGKDGAEVNAGVDLYYSYEEEKLLFLAEYFINRDEKEFERIQIGYALDENSKLWFGRFHNPLGFWNTEYHHGAYLQTSIARPSIAAFEDGAGILPMHVFGVLYETDHYFDSGYLNINLAAGAAPAIQQGKMEPVEFFRPGKQAFHENYTMRFTYFPKVVDNDQFGVFAGYSLIEGDGITSQEIKQFQAGLFGLYESGRSKLLSSIYFIKNHLISSVVADNKGRFSSGYIQLEYMINSRWIAYARLENTYANANDPFLALAPEHIGKRELVGMRFESVDKQALNIEFQQGHKSSGAEYQVLLQWSALLP